MKREKKRSKQNVGTIKKQNKTKQQKQNGAQRDNGRIKDTVQQYNKRE